MRSLLVVVLCVNAFLLAWTELAWLGLWVGSVPLPITVLLALVTTPMLVSASAAATGGGGFPPLAVWALTVVIAGLWGPAGVGVAPADWRAVLLIAAGLLPGMVVAARRSARPRTPVDAPSQPVGS